MKNYNLAHFGLFLDGSYICIGTMESLIGRVYDDILSNNNKGNFTISTFDVSGDLIIERTRILSYTVVDNDLFITKPEGL